MKERNPLNKRRGEGRNDRNRGRDGQANETRGEAVVWVRRDQDRRQLWAFDARDAPFVQGPEGEALLRRERVAPGEFLVVRRRTLSRGRASWRLELVERLGQVGDVDLAERVVCRHLGIPCDYSAEALLEAATLENQGHSSAMTSPTGEGPTGPQGAKALPRRDLTALNTVTIDGADARDYDDAISIEKHADGHRLWVHIADVAFWVPEGSEIDREARRRGTSVYFPEHALHMLPAYLAEEVCSLRPGEPRHCLSIALDYDQQGRRFGERLETTRITSNARLTYGQAEDLLAGRDQESAEPAVRTLLGEAAVLESRIRALRRADGRLEIDTEWPAVLFDSRGRPVVATDLSLRSRQLIETFMVEANIAVADWLADRFFGEDLASTHHLDPRLDDTAGRRETSTSGGNEPNVDRPASGETLAPFRWHPPPPSENLERLLAAAQALGFPSARTAHESLRQDSSATEARGLMQDLLADGKRLELGAVTGQLVVRSLARAVYWAEPKGHFALAAGHYCHFTSPIRRYPDLVVHRAVRHLLAAEFSEQAMAAESARRPSFGPTDAEELSLLERRAEVAEREVLRWRGVERAAVSSRGKLEGMVTGVERFGLFVTILELGVDGLVTCESLSGGTDFRLDSSGVALERDGEGYRLGDRVTVCIIDVQIEERRVRLEMVSPPRSLARRQRHGS